MKRIPSFILLLLLYCTGFAQQKWNLKQCVDYALVNNISVKQADVQARFDKLTHDQSILALYPTISSSHGIGLQFGRSIDRTSNQFTTTQFLNTNHGIDVGLDLFNWFRKKNTVAANDYLAQASAAKLEKAKNDIALNVANAYLAALLNNEQINISKVQLDQSREQMENIKKQVNAGALPELNLAEAQTQFATDSSNLITAQTNYKLALLQLMAVLNVDADKPFEIAIPTVESIPLEPLSALDPALVYQSALENLPQQKINNLNLKAGEKNVAVAKAALYPSLSFYGGLSTAYSNVKTNPLEYSTSEQNIGYVQINGVDYDVMSPIVQITKYGRDSYLKQLNNNFGQNVGLGLSIPIFNGGAARINWKKAKLNVESQQLLKEQDAQNLKQDIYQAHTNAVAAIEKFNASKIAVESAQKAYDFAKKRFDVGLLQPIDLITNQNNLFRAKINRVSAQYDYVFKMKLLEFYKGLGLKL
ncbi:MAG: TolC family protein [Niabella sp.]